MLCDSWNLGLFLNELFNSIEFYDRQLWFVECFSKMNLEKNTYVPPPIPPRKNTYLVIFPTKHVKPYPSTLGKSHTNTSQQSQPPPQRHRSWNWNRFFSFSQTWGRDWAGHQKSFTTFWKSQLLLSYNIPFAQVNWANLWMKNELTSPAIRNSLCLAAKDIPKSNIDFVEATKKSNRNRIRPFPS